MSWRTSPLPKDWPRRRLRALERDGHRCTVVTEGKRCTAKASDVHHIGDPTDHRLENLGSICAWHHKKETSAQANRARKRLTQKHPTERHPGIK